MSRALIIGAGGVAGVAAHKCCQNYEVFTDIMIASRTKSKCDKLKQSCEEYMKKFGGKTNIETARVDADNVDELTELIGMYRPEIVINLALPYQDMSIMDACLRSGVH